MTPETKAVDDLYPIIMSQEQVDTFRQKYRTEVNTLLIKDIIEEIYGSND